MMLLIILIVLQALFDVWIVCEFLILKENEVSNFRCIGTINEILDKIMKIISSDKKENNNE